MKYLNIIVVVVLFLSFRIVNAREVCQFQYTGTLDSLKGSTLILPNETVAMQQEVILESFIDEIEESRPVSIFIIMDQTASMGAQDPNGNRHKALAKILDAIEDKSPDSEIGGVFFGNDLGLDTSDDQLFIASPHSSKGYGYIPFLKINDNYESDNNGTARGIDQFRYFFQLADSSLNHLEWEINHGPGSDTTWTYFFSYTNIDAPFLAAREAFESASNPAKDQYIIFFSDGGDNCGSTQFTTGEATPTTFSVFITSTTNPTYNIIPKELDTMITNIKNNGYSTSNGFSEIWAVNTEDEVMEKVDSAILEVVIKNKTVTPDTIKINGVTSVGSWDSTGLSLEGPVPLTEIPDTFIQVLSYESVEIINNDTTVDQVVDTSKFYIDRSDFNQSVNVATAWWEREIFFYNRNDYTIDIDSIDDSIGVLFTQDDLDNVYNYDSITVNLSASSGDMEIIKLNNLNDSFFVILPLSFSSANLNNKALECGNADTITVFYQNPILPLDTITTKIVLNKPDEVLADAFLSASPGDTVYGTKYLEVLLETDSGNLIIYEVLNMDSTVISGPDTIITNGTVEVSGDVIITATATGVNFNSKDSSWSYNCELPNAKLSALPGDVVYNTLTLDVELETDSGNLIVYEVLNMDSVVISGPDTINTKGIVTFSGDVILKAIAFGENYTTKDSIWTYDCELPNAKLSALPGDVVYNTLTLDVELETDSGNLIVYEVLNMDSAVISGPDTINTKGIVTFSGDVILKAFAFGENYATTDSIWTYDCELPQLTINSSLNNNSEFTIDTTIFLTTYFGSEIVKSKIYYSISYTGDGAIPDSLTGILYDPLQGITISNNATIYAIAYNDNYVSAKGVWSYNLKLLDIKISATPSNDSSYGIGYLLDSIIIETTPSEGITTTWIVSTDSITDSVTLISNGIQWDSINLPSITTNDSDDFYYLSVIAMGEGYSTEIKVFKYTKQKLPDIIATPYESGGYKFSNSVDVTLNVLDSLGVFENVQIHYFLDTMAVGIQAQGSDSSYGNPTSLNIDTTIFIKAIATADNAINSNLFVGYYILETSVVGAWYKDESANDFTDTVDGIIDAVTINLNRDVAILPDSVLLISPYDTTEKIIITKGEITFDSLSNSVLRITLSNSFKSNNLAVNTSVDTLKTPKLGALFGKYYSENHFSIKDSIKPLIQYAIYYPGKYELSGDTVSVHSDTILLAFSEKVHIPGLSLDAVVPATFYSYSKDLEYSMNLNFVSNGNRENEIKFVVESIDKSVIPEIGDSVRINFKADISDMLGNTQNIEGNRYGYIRDVGERKYPYSVKAFTPVVPSEYEIPEEIKSHSTCANSISHGLMIIADFYTIINTEKMNDAEIVIYDLLGNIIASHEGYGDGNNVAIDLVTIDEPKNKTMILFLWNGTNNNNRQVGAGAYLAQISFTDPYGNKISERVTLGVAMRLR